MANELQIKPLLRYEVFLRDSTIDVFTADCHVTDDEITKFYRTGNVIREYHGVIDKVMVTPANA